MGKLHSLLRSRRFIFAVGGVIFAISDGLGLGLDQETVNIVCGLIAAWCVSDGLRHTE